MMCMLKNQGLTGYIEYRGSCNSYIVRVYTDASLAARVTASVAPADPLYVMSFGNGVLAEDRLLALMEHPAWTLLRFT